jgi:hypothetical protein
MTTAAPISDRDAVRIVRELVSCGGLGKLAGYIDIAGSGESFTNSGNYACHVGPISFFVKLAMNQRFPEHRWDTPRPPLAPSMTESEISVMRAIRTRIIAPGYTPHFVEILAVARCDDVASALADREKCDQIKAGKIPDDVYPQSVLCHIDGLAKLGRADDVFTLVFSERCSVSLLYYLQRFAPALMMNRIEAISSIIFQIYYSLACAQRIWPGFHHGDLRIHNIMMKIVAVSATPTRQYIRYRLGSRAWLVPYTGLVPKIIDFGHSQIPEEGIYTPTIVEPRIPDHATFIISLEYALFDMGHAAMVLRSVIPKLNPDRATINTRMSHLAEHSGAFPTPERALDEFFEMFEVAVSEDDVRDEYIGPPPSLSSLSASRGVLSSDPIKAPPRATKKP